MQDNNNIGSGYPQVNQTNEEYWFEEPRPAVPAPNIPYRGRGRGRGRNRMRGRGTSQSYSNRSNSYQSDFNRDRGKGYRKNWDDSRNWNSKQEDKDNSSCGTTEPNKNNDGSDSENKPFTFDMIRAQIEEEERKRFAHLPEVVKVTYIECEEVKNMKREEVLSLRKRKNDITVTGLDGKEPSNVPNLVETFDQAFKGYPKILKVIKAQGFKEPSPIQSQLWPIIMSGHDAIGIAQTGTGKTLAYLLPALLHIEKQPYFRDKNRTGPVCVIMAPTRELAQQIHSEVAKFPYKNIRSTCIYGKGDFNKQLETLQSGVEIVVATPGRLIDFDKREMVDLRGVSYLVLDEADRMLDMGFMSDMVYLMMSMREDKQFIMTTATFFCDVQYIVERKMKNPLKVNVGDLDLAAVDTVTQTIRVCEEDDKKHIVVEILKNIKSTDKVIVFTNRKAVANHLPCLIFEYRMRYSVMHGDLEQSDREQSLRDLKSGECNIMFATDLAARGLDVKDLTMVINYDLPRNLEEYVHRSGRTGRAGKTGEVISLVSWDDRNQVAELIKILKRTNQDVPIELQKMAERAQRQKDNRNRGRGRGRRGSRGMNMYSF